MFMFLLNEVITAVWAKLGISRGVLVLRGMHGVKDEYSSLVEQTASGESLRGPCMFIYLNSDLDSSVLVRLS